MTAETASGDWEMGRQSSLIPFALLVAVASVSAGTCAAEEARQRFFARSGDELVLPAVEELRFHRIVIPPSAPHTFVMPSVRAPLVLTGFDDSGRDVAEFVVYPHEVKPSVEPISVKYAGTPIWFEQWADVTSRAETSKDPKGAPTLLVVGAGEAGDHPRSILALVERYDVKTVLVLGACWYGHPTTDPFRLTTLHSPWGEKATLLGGESGVVFPNRRRPTPALVNRTPCLAVKGDAPILEELLLSEKAHVLVSYLPWQAQLGRREEVDALFYSTLQHAARLGSEPFESYPDAGVTLQWPRSRDVLETERPVVHALLKRRYRSVSAVHLVDLRGAPIQAAKRTQLRAALRHRPLIILGTDPMLAAADYRQPAVRWIADDTLPPDEDAQRRLMENLTEAGVLLP
jgi:hypothetical protein